MWEDDQRAKLAEEVARTVNEGKPKTLEQLEALLADHLGEQLRDYPDADNPSHSYRGFQLLPRVLLRLWVEYETETGNIVDTWMIYAFSERISLDAPRDGMPGAPPFYAWLIAVVPAVLCGGVWLRVSRNMTVKGWANRVLAVAAALPLLLYVPMAVICYLRITM